MFDPDKYYAADDPQLNALVTYSTLASYRHEGRGPAYAKIGRRIMYLGKDLNAWLAARRVATSESQPEAA